MSDTFLYFAYGSNMFTRRLTAPRRAPSAAAEGTGFVVGRRLTFDKASRDGSGKCDIELAAPNERVYGVLFKIAAAEEVALDHAEGLGRGYRKENLEVITMHGPVSAIAYVATAKEPGRRPYDWYKAYVVAGAVEHGLPSVYIEWLRTFPALPDADAGRRAENEAVLLGGASR
jgi:hypothetical protein